jgi:hypothetical protein
MEKRKAFNFYKSYYEVAMKLSVEDRCEFLTALMKKQFEDIEPTLSGMAEFAYISQKHTIESQVEGYKNKISSTPTEPPLVPPTEPPSVPPSVQEKEKEKEKELVKEKVIDILDTSTGIFDDIIFGNKKVEGIDEVLKKYNL